MSTATLELKIDVGAEVENEDATACSRNQGQELKTEKNCREIYIKNLIGSIISSISFNEDDSYSYQCRLILEALRVLKIEYYTQLSPKGFPFESQKEILNKICDFNILKSREIKIIENCIVVSCYKVRADDATSLGIHTILIPIQQLFFKIY